MDPLLQFILALAAIAWLSRLAIGAGSAAGLPVGLSKTLTGLVQA